jgi:hypothetical protein
MYSEMTTKLDLFKNPFFSAVVSYLILAIVALFYFQGWILLFSVFFSFVLSDVILNFFIREVKNGQKSVSTTFLHVKDMHIWFF